MCGLTVSGAQYTAICYRPFKLANASPYDFPALGLGSTIELGFAVGEFSLPGDHAATDMSTYVLTFSNQTFTATATTSSSSTTSSSTASSSNTTATQPTSVSNTTSLTSTSKSDQNIFAGFPGLNLITLYVTGTITIVFGVLLGVGVALRARKLEARS